MGNIETFTDRHRRDQRYRSVADRTKDTDPVTVPFIAERAQQQASRCAGCGSAGCQVGCPLGNDIRAWLNEIAGMRLHKHELDKYGLDSNDLDAVGGFKDIGFDERSGKSEDELRSMASVNIYQMLRLTQYMTHENARQFFKDKMSQAIEITFTTNPMPEVTGMVCPQENLCESPENGDYGSGCTHGVAGHGSVAVGSVEQFIGQIARQYDLFPDVAPPAKYERAESIGIIGSGPAAYAAAWRARQNGIQVTIYESSDRPGGLLQYGIPDDKLPKDIVDYYYEWLGTQGVEIVTNTSVGKDITLKELTQRHTEVVLATGAGKLNPLRCDNGHLATGALDFLEAANRNVRGEGLDPKYNAEGKNVVIIGAGDTAMDTIRTSIRQAHQENAGSIKVLYYRGKEDVTASDSELKKVIAELGEENFIFFSNIQEIIADNDQVSEVTYAKSMQVDPGTGVGKKRIESTYETATISADMVINATGFSIADLNKAFGIEGLQQDRSGVQVSTPYKIGKQLLPMHGLAGVFNESAAGDTPEAKVTPLSVIGDLRPNSNLVVQGLRNGRDLGDVLSVRFECLQEKYEEFVRRAETANIPNVRFV